MTLGHECEYEVTLRGLDGGTPLGFLAAIGVQRVVGNSLSPDKRANPRLGWRHEGRWRPVLRSSLGQSELVALLDEDRSRLLQSDLLGDGSSRFRYLKAESNGIKEVRGLRPPVPVLRGFLSQWVRAMNPELLGYSAALLVETATEVLGKDKTVSHAEVAGRGIPGSEGEDFSRILLPAPLDFTARNEQLLQQVRVIGESLDGSRLNAEIFTGEAHGFRAAELRWSQDAEAPAALYTVGRPIHSAKEWAAFRALPAFPSSGDARGVRTASCRGLRKKGQFVWCTWEGWLTPIAVRSLVTLREIESLRRGDLREYGIVERFSAALTKTVDEYGGALAPTVVL